MDLDGIKKKVQIWTGKNASNFWGHIWTVFFIAEPVARHPLGITVYEIRVKSAEDAFCLGLNEASTGQG